MKNLIITLIFLISFVGFSQKTLSKLLKEQNTESIPYITVKMLANKNDSLILLDSREQKEYNISHLKNAMYVGYDFFNLDSIQRKLPNKNSKIVVYCSLGIRSEDIAEKLKKVGYINIFNLYGGVFEWKNQGLPVFDLHNIETEKVNAFSEAWSKWLIKGEKVYD